MDFDEAESQFHEVRRRYERGEFSSDEFYAAVNTLRFSDTDGYWWQIRAEDGGWLLWNGSTWDLAERKPPGPNKDTISGVREPVEDLQEPGERSRQSVSVQFIRLVLISMWAQIRKKWYIILILFFMLWIAVTLAVMTFASLSKQVDSPWGQFFLNIAHLNIPTYLFVFFLSWIIGLLFISITAGRVTKGFWNIITIPSWIAAAFRPIGIKSLYLVLFGVVSALLITAIINSRLITIQLFLITGAAIMSRQGGLFNASLACLWRDMQSMVFGWKNPTGYQIRWGVAGLTGLIVGFAIGSLGSLAAELGSILVIWILLGIFGIVLITSTPKGPIAASGVK